MTDHSAVEVAAREAVDAARRMLPEAVDPGVLYVVSTPIGHLGDCSLRALRVLDGVDRILCEDTRHALVLLSRYGIRTSVTALHEHNEARSVRSVIEALAGGSSLALISDAGTPLVSDPGARLVEAVIAAGVRVIPVPGASAALAALVASGLPAHPSTILGFLPRKGRERREMLEWAAHCPHTVVFYEAPSRVVATLDDLQEVAGAERPAVVAREITKHFEEFQRGTLESLSAYYTAVPPRGEVVILVAPSPAPTAPTDASLNEAATTMRTSGLPPREIMQLLMQDHGASRNTAYRLAHES